MQGAGVKRREAGARESHSPHTRVCADFLSSFSFLPMLLQRPSRTSKDGMILTITCIPNADARRAVADHVLEAHDVLKGTFIGQAVILHTAVVLQSCCRLPPSPSDSQSSPARSYFILTLNWPKVWWLWLKFPIRQRKMFGPLGCQPIGSNKTT